MWIFNKLLLNLSITLCFISWKKFSQETIRLGQNKVKIWWYLKKEILPVQSIIEKKAWKQPFFKSLKLKKKENHEFIHKRKNRREEKQNIPSFGKKSIKNTDLAYPLNTEKKKKKQQQQTERESVKATTTANLNGYHAGIWKVR